MPVRLTLTLTRREDRDVIAEALEEHASRVVDVAAGEAGRIVTEHRGGKDGRSRAMHLVQRLAEADHLASLAAMVRDAEVSS